jgi:GT2 family glycosyltransferase
MSEYSRLNPPPTLDVTEDSHRGLSYPILVVIVLYKQAPSKSRAFSSISAILNTNLDFAKYFTFILYDNSPEPHDPIPQLNFPIYYKHDPTNGGLAPAYNLALASAVETGCQWLLLLDQDTSSTFEFISELIGCIKSMAERSDVASIIPKLLVKGRINSPAADFIDQVRHQYRRSTHAVVKDLVGVQEKRLGAYNSGATLRVSALQSIGGFPKEFWLDYLDHAVFHKLSEHRYKMYVMSAILDHEFSQTDINCVPIWRQRNILFAQSLFVKHAGGFFDRLLYRIWLLRQSRGFWIDYRDRRLWKETALQALLLRIPKDRGNNHSSKLPSA